MILFSYIYNNIKNIVMKTPTLQEARNRYPIGTIFSNINLGFTCTNIKVKGCEFKYNYDNRISICDGNTNHDGSFTVYKDGKWADIDKHDELNYEVY